MTLISFLFVVGVHHPAPPKIPVVDLLRKRLHSNFYHNILTVIYSILVLTVLADICADNFDKLSIYIQIDLGKEMPYAKNY